MVEKTKITDKNLMANNLNEHFAHKGHILASKLPEPQTSILDTMRPRNQNYITQWENTYSQEIVDISKSDINLYTSPGYDNIPALLIKWSASHIAPLLALIFNKFLSLGKYPKFLKIAKVTALHKGGDKIKA